MKLFIESVSIRLRYVFWCSFFVEKVIIIIFILIKEIVNLSDIKVIDIVLWKSVIFKEDFVVFLIGLLNVWLLINMIWLLFELEFKILVLLFLINCFLLFMCLDFLVVVMFIVFGLNVCLFVDLIRIVVVVDRVFIVVFFWWVVVLFNLDNLLVCKFLLDIFNWVIRMVSFKSRIDFWKYFVINKNFIFG